jgi:hypothetical protein
MIIVDWLEEWIMVNFTGHSKGHSKGH